MNEELKTLEENHTWNIIDLPLGKKPIGCKWICKVKLHPDGPIERYKVRVVVKGYTQIPGINYYNSFSLVAKVVTFKLFLVIGASQNRPVE